MPVGGSVTDNFSGGGIVSPISLDSGALGVARSKLLGNSIPAYSEHPDTGQPLAGTCVPHWAQVKELACKAQRLFDVVSIAWDIALTKKGLVVLEGNWNYDLRLFEVPHGVPLNQTRYSIFYDAWMQRAVGGQCKSPFGAHLTMDLLLVMPIRG
jgi:hypothetical protein